MPGTVTQLGKTRWRLRVSMGKDPATGRYRSASRTVQATSRRQAQAQLDSFVQELQADPRLSTSATVGRLLDDWLELIEEDRSPTTIRAYRSYIEAHLRPALGAIPLRDLTAKPIDDLYRDLRSSGRSPRTIRQIHAILHRALDQAIDWEWMTANPADRAKPPAARKAHIAPPSPAQIAQLVEAARERDPGLATFVLLASMTGARRGELCALRWADVDLEGGSMRIWRSLVDVGGRLLEKGTKTNQARVIALPPEAVTILRAHRAILAARSELQETDPGAYVWPAPYSLSGREPWRPDQVTGAFRRLCQATGLDVRLHGLRHAQATQLLAAGVDVRTVAGRLGHANPSTTLSIYAAWVPAADRAAAAISGTLFGGAPELPGP